ncbi:MAG TPA: hypothetical protein V6D19_18085 [Stenomitos sp.]
MSFLKPPWLTQCFWIVLAIAVVVYLLRGFAVLTMIPGGLVSGLWVLAISLGIYLVLVSLR